MKKLNSVVDVVERFHRFGNDVAVVHHTLYRTFKYTYHDLYHKILRYQTCLQNNNIRKGDAVVLWSQNSIEWMAAFFAIIRQGGIAVPLIGGVHADLVREVCKRVGAETVIGPGGPCCTLTFKQLDESVEQAVSACSATSDSLLEIMFTSGTTSTPKGVILSHKNIVSNLNSLCETISLKRETVLCPLPFSHMFGQLVGMLAPMSEGSTVVLTDSLFPGRLLDIIKKDRISILVAVPRILDIIKDVLPSAVQLRLFGFKHIVCGGAALDLNTERTLVNKWYSLLPGYGLTETSPIISAGVPGEYHEGSAGKIMPCNQVKIVDDEIWVSGDNVFPGYFNDEKKTKEVFSKKWFKTGDLGEIRDGWLYIKGRKDDLIVTADGKKIYPDDMESVVSEIIGNKNVCCFGVKDEVHIVTMQQVTEFHRKQIQGKLHSWQRISNWHIWKGVDFPRTATKKVQRNAVRQKILQHEKVNTKDKGLIVQILEKILSRPVDGKKTLQQLGVSSLQTVHLSVAIEQQTGMPVLAVPTDVKVNNLLGVIKKQKPLVQRAWVFSWFVHLIARLYQEIFFFNWTRGVWNIQYSGERDVPDKGPYLIISNHQSHLDSGIIMATIPWKLRYKLAVAARSEYFVRSSFFDRKLWRFISFNLITIFHQAFLLSQTRGYQQTFQFMGKLVDKDWNILIFPEGERSPKMKPFKQGIGFLVKELRVPVVPIALDGVWKLLPPGRAAPRFFNKCWIRVGKPIYFSPFETSQDITNKCQEEVSRLYDEIQLLKQENN